MTRPLEKHLDGDELDELISLRGTSVSGSEQLSEPLSEAQRHVESCQDCSRKLQRHQFLHSEILRMRVPNPSSATSACMGDAEWLEAAAGLLPEAKTRELMKHAAQCGHCGQLLKNAAEALADEATATEEALLASLQSARPEWSKNMAAALQERVRDRAPKSSWWTKIITWPTPAYALASIVAVAVVAWIGLRALHTRSAEQLLAEAYSENRTLEVRIPGAKFAPLRVERGPSGSNLDKPQSLLRAETLIGENLRKDPNNASWLQAKARADLLDGNFDSAITTLQRALQAHPDSATLLTDLGSGYYERAEAANRPIDYGKAIDVLGKALAHAPNDSVAVFNRAVVEEKLHLYNPAISDWQHYLELDPTGSWADEARKRLLAIEEKVRTKQSSLVSPLLTPTQIIALSPKARADELNDRIEDYLREAVEKWLPDYIAPAARTQAEHNSGGALTALADVLRTRHGDLWLSALLAEPRGPIFDNGVMALSMAVKANHNGNYTTAQIAARNASRLFSTSRNVAAELRANLEQVYAEHLLYDGPSCAAIAGNTIWRLRSFKYQWLGAQVRLEESNCFDLLGNLGESKQALDLGTQIAKDNGFAELFVRGIGFQADAAASFGDTQTGFSLASTGLDLFWSSQVGVMKGYNLYTDLDTAADILRLPYLQVALWNEATSLIDLHPDVVQRAMAHRWYGNAAYLAEMPELARQEFSKATLLFSSAPRTRATLRGMLDADIWLAGLATRTGDVDRASALLSRVAGNLSDAPGFAQEIGFYTDKAELSLKEGDLDSCEAALRSAVSLAERARASLSSETARQQWMKQTRLSYQTLVAWKLRQGDVTSALEYWEWYTGSSVRSSDGYALESHDYTGHSVHSDLDKGDPLRVPTAVTQQLPVLRGKTVIAYLVFPEGIASWAFNDLGVSAHWTQKPERELEESTARFLELCADRDSDASALRSSARELYDLLIAPFEHRLATDRTLVIEPDGPLSKIPFNALVDGQGHYLLERDSVVISPGLYQSMQARKPQIIGPSTPALIVSVPSLDDGSLARVTAAETETQAIARLFSGARELEGSAATIAEINRNIIDAGVFHFAGHAISSPESNGLLLNEKDSKTLRSRILNAESVSPRALRKLQLVVLSACATGVDLEPGASGTESLSAAILRAGVPDVIASRWNVDSEATRLLMDRFYNELLSGRTAADSLRDAQIEMTAQSGTTHPYYWASFGVLGI